MARGNDYGWPADKPVLVNPSHGLWDQVRAGSQTMSKALSFLLLFVFVACNEELAIVLRINSSVRTDRERRVSCADGQIEKQFVP